MMASPIFEGLDGVWHKNRADMERLRVGFDRFIYRVFVWSQRRANMHVVGVHFDLSLYISSVRREEN